MFRKCVSDEAHVLSYEDLELQADLSYEEQPVHIRQEGQGPEE